MAMGTRFELVLAGLDEVSLRAAGEEAIDEIRHWHDRLSAFAPGSQLNELCRVACDRPVPLDYELFELFHAACEVCERSGGALDITLGALMHALGLRGDSCRQSAGRQSDRQQMIDTARARTGMHLVELDAASRALRLRIRDMQLDLGAIAKGFAIDRAGAVLREAGVACALIHGGTSSVLAIGAPPDQASWRIAIADPSDAARTLGIAQLCDTALGVSAPNGRVVEHDGVRIGHVLDPRTGEPTEAASLAAVVAPSAMLADAWSTALLVLGAVPGNLPVGLDALVVCARACAPARARVLGCSVDEEIAV